MSTPFESKRLVYRPFNTSQTGDANWFLKEIASDVETRFLSSADHLIRPLTPNDYHQQVKDICDRSLLGVIICKKATDEPSSHPVAIGYIQLTDEAKDATAVTAHHNRKTKLFIQICKGIRCQGYGTEAIHWALNWAFKMAGMHRVAVSTMSYNLRVLRWYKRIGFVEEGKERDGCWFNGAWHNIFTLSMLEDDWKALKDGTKQRSIEMMAEGSEGSMDGYLMKELHL